MRLIDFLFNALLIIVFGGISGFCDYHAQVITEQRAEVMPTKPQADKLVVLRPLNETFWMLVFLLIGEWIGRSTHWYTLIGQPYWLNMLGLTLEMLALTFVANVTNYLLLYRRYQQSTEK